MKKICIAGGHGGMGNEMVKELKQKGYDIHIISREENRSPDCDVLILNSGIGWFGPLEDLDDKKLKDLMWVNLERHILLTKSVIKEWKKRKSGHLIFIASNCAYEGFSENNAYAGTKAGLLGFARSLYKEVNRNGIKVTVISPGTTNTDFWLTANADHRDKCNPVEPSEIARAVSFALEMKANVSEMIILPTMKD